MVKSGTGDIKWAILFQVILSSFIHAIDIASQTNGIHIVSDRLAPDLHRFNPVAASVNKGICLISASIKEKITPLNQSFISLLAFRPFMFVMVGCIHMDSEERSERCVLTYNKPFQFRAYIGSKTAQG